MDEETGADAAVRRFEAARKPRTMEEQPEEQPQTKVLRRKSVAVPKSMSSPTAVVDHERQSKQETSKAIKVFIGIKTRGVQENSRLAQIQKTWLKDATADSGISVKFFTRDQVTTRNALESNITTLDSMESSLMVPTMQCSDVDLRCKTASMFTYFLDHDTDSSFFCNFDDDNYVLTSNLMDVLQSYYDKDPTKELYIGRQSRPSGVRLPNKRFHGAWLHFVTGGAGYCLSRNLVERGRRYFEKVHPKGLPDDMSVGYIVQETLKVKLQEDVRFHSHLETEIRTRFFTKETIGQQVSFGFNDKLEDRELAVKAMPGIPVPFSPEQDPMMFLSLRCYLKDTSISNSTSMTMSNDDVQCPSSS